MITFILPLFVHLGHGRFAFTFQACLGVAQQCVVRNTGAGIGRDYCG